MNPLIKEQLKKIARIDLPQFDEDTLIISIPRANKAPERKFEQDRCYLISLEDYILKPPDGFTLHANWNKSNIPKCKFMYVEILDVMGKMVKVNGVEFDFINKQKLDYIWEGWLPEKSVTIIERL